MIYARLENQSYSISVAANTQTVLYYSNATVVDATSSYFTLTTVPYSTITFAQQGTFLVNAGQSWTVSGTAQGAFTICIQLLPDGSSTWKNIAAHTVQNNLNNTSLKNTMASVAYRFFTGDVIRVVGTTVNTTTTITPASNVASGAAYPFLSVALCLP